MMTSRPVSFVGGKGRTMKVSRWAYVAFGYVRSVSLLFGATCVGWLGGRCAEPRGSSAVLVGRYGRNYLNWPSSPVLQQWLQGLNDMNLENELDLLAADLARFRSAKIDRLTLVAAAKATHVLVRGKMTLLVETQMRQNGVNFKPIQLVKHKAA